jgi:hypothetical protein
MRFIELAWHRQCAQRLTTSQHLDLIQKRRRAHSKDLRKKVMKARKRNRRDDQAAFNSVLNLIALGTALILLFSAGGVGTGIARAMGS